MSLLDFTSEQYHADPCAEPSLNSTTARILLEKTPAHAKAQHPRLSDVPLEPKTSDAMDMGTAVHQLLLRDDRVDVAYFPDYRKAEARSWRDEVRAAGRIPMLAHQWDKALAISQAVREQMQTLSKPTPFTAGTPEATVCWQEDNAWCRARLDWLRDDLETIDDLKCTSRSANPKVWERQLFSLGYDIQAALYVRAVEKTQGRTPTFRWIVAETCPPYAVSVVQLSEHAMFAAGVKVDAALAIWRDCMESGRWPAYSTEVHIAEIPAWQKDSRDSAAWAELAEETVPF